MTNNAIALPVKSEIVDQARIRFGGGYRLPKQVADAGRVRIGGGYRLAR